jgi:hypothetical protein
MKHHFENLFLKINKLLHPSSMRKKHCITLNKFTMWLGWRPTTRHFLVTLVRIIEIVFK